MRFLLTGATGFIGQNLTRKLRARGDDVSALVRSTSITAPLVKAGARLFIGDVARNEGLDAALEGIDCVLHLAGATKARTAAEYDHANGEGTRNLLVACAGRSRVPKLVYCSSLAAAGPSVPGQPKTERDAALPISKYGRSKLAGELAVREFADRVPSVIVRPPIVYGPADKEFIPSLLPMARLGVQLKSGFGEKRYSLVHVDDLCDGLIAAADKGRTVVASDPSAGVYHLSDGREYTWEQVCESLARSLGKSRPIIVPVPELVSFAAGLGGELQARLRGSASILNLDKAREMRCPAWTCSSERAQKELGFAPRFTLENGMPQTLEWYRQEGIVR